MAVRVLPTGTIGIPLSPPPAPEPPPLELDNEEPTLHLVGRSEQRLAEALFETESVDAPYSADTVRALRLLAMDNLVDIIQLRELVQEREAQVAALTGEVDLWRTRAWRSTPTVPSSSGSTSIASGSSSRSCTAS